MACGARIGPEKQKQRLCNTNNGLERKLSRPERVDMIMRKMLFCFLSGLILLTGCAEGKQISLSPESGAETSTAIVTEDQNAGEMVAEKATDTLKEVNDNIVYHLQSWQLYDTLTAAGIAKEDLDEDINEDLIKNYDAARRILVLTIQISCEGENEDGEELCLLRFHASRHRSDYGYRLRNGPDGLHAVDVQAGAKDSGH